MPGKAVVIFDLGGVVLDSPIKSLLQYAKRFKGSSVDVNGLVGASNSWKKLERGEIRLNEFYKELREELGGNDDVSPEEVISIIASSLSFRSGMIDLIHFLKRNGYIVAALTNNWLAEKSISTGFHQSGLYSLFHHVFESAKLGMRKPEPRIYQHVISSLQLDTSVDNVIFLDDIGKNLKPAKEFGMKTIKVTFEPNCVEKAINQLEELLKCNLSWPIPMRNITECMLHDWTTTLKSKEIAKIVKFFSHDAFYRDDSVSRGLLGQESIRHYIQNTETWANRIGQEFQYSIEENIHGGFIAISTNNYSNEKYRETFIFDQTDKTILRYEIQNIFRESKL